MKLNGPTFKSPLVDTTGIVTHLRQEGIDKWEKQARNATHDLVDASAETGDPLQSSQSKSRPTN